MVIPGEHEVILGPLSLGQNLKNIVYEDDSRQEEGSREEAGPREVARLLEGLWNILKALGLILHTVVTRPGGTWL